jgi:hypothetical protein
LHNPNKLESVTLLASYARPGAAASYARPGAAASYARPGAAASYARPGAAASYARSGAAASYARSGAVADAEALLSLSATVVAAVGSPNSGMDMPAATAEDRF